jgi:hypothetical protein
MIAAATGSLLGARFAFAGRRGAGFAAAAADFGREARLRRGLAGIAGSNARQLGFEFGDHRAGENRRGDPGIAGLPGFRRASTGRGAVAPGVRT